MKKEERESFNFMVDMMDMLCAPIITYDPKWMEKVPEKLLNKIQGQRMISALRKSQMATDAEVVAYLMTAASVFPLNHDWYEIQIECFTRVFPEEGKLIDPEHRPLDKYKEEHLLNPLKKAIWKARREEMKRRVRVFDETQKPVLETEAEAKFEQLELF